MAEDEEIEYFAVYSDWTTRSNGSLTHEQLSLGSLGDALVCVVAAILAVITAGGNLLVVISYRMDRHLQTVTNYFLLSLSVADFTIGAISMPLYTAYLVLGYWPMRISRAVHQKFPIAKCHSQNRKKSLTDSLSQARPLGVVYTTLQTLYVLYMTRETPVF